MQTLSGCIKARDKKGIKALLHDSAQINALNEQGLSPLYQAVVLNFPDIVALLIEEGANPDFVEKEGGWSCLQLAASRNQQEIVEILVNKVNDIDFRDQFGQTAILIAARNGHCDTVKLLADSGANLEIPKQDTEETPLLRALIYGHEKTAITLIEHGAQYKEISVDGLSIQQWSERESMHDLNHVLTKLQLH